jgi:hypothetical protein
MKNSLLIVFISLSFKVASQSLDPLSVSDTLKFEKIKVSYCKADSLLIMYEILDTLINPLGYLVKDKENSSYKLALKSKNQYQLFTIFGNDGNDITFEKMNINKSEFLLFKQNSSYGMEDGGHQIEFVNIIDLKNLSSLTLQTKAYEWGTLIKNKNEDENVAEEEDFIEEEYIGYSYYDDLNISIINNALVIIQMMKDKSDEDNTCSSSSCVHFFKFQKPYFLKSKTHCLD